MSQRHSLPFPMPGKTGRRTGISVYGTPKRGINGLEDLNNFYLSDDDINDSNNNNNNNASSIDTSTSPLKRLSLHSNKQQQHYRSIQENKQTEEDNSSFEDEIKSAEHLGPPIKISARDLNQLTGQTDAIDLKNGSKLTKNIALNKSSKNKIFNSQLITNELPDQNNRSSLVTTRKKPVEIIESDIEMDNEKEPIESDNAINNETTANDERLDPKENEASEKESLINHNESLFVTESDEDSDTNKKDVEISEKTTNEVSEISPQKTNKVLTNDSTDGEISVENNEEIEEEEEEEGEIDLPGSSIDRPEELVSSSNESQEDLGDKSSSSREEPIKPVKINKTILTPRLLNKSLRSLILKSPNTSNTKSSNSKPSQIVSPEKEKQPQSDNPDPDPDSDSKPKPKPKANANTKAKAKASAKSSTTLSQEPIRRSSRHRVPPVASWKNEKVVYKTEKINGVYVKTMKNIEPPISSAPVAIGSPPQSLSPSQLPRKKISSSRQKVSKAAVSSKKRNREETEVATASTKKKAKVSKAPTPTPVPASLSNKTKSLPVSKGSSKKSKTKISKVTEEEEPIPGTEWQNHSSMTIPVFEGPGTGTQVERIVAWAPNKYKNVTLINNEEENFRISTLFDVDSEFCGAGLIEIASGDKKAVKSNNDTYFIFHVIEGSMSVSINNTTFTVTKGCTFEIPMGNYYQFVNAGSSTVKLLFVQAKYIVIGESGSESDSDSEEEEDDEEDEEGEE